MNPKQKALDNLLFVITGLLVFLMAARTPLDTDLWWHLRAGEVTLHNQSPLLVDPFSFTRHGEAWTNHSWLAQVGLFLAFKYGEYTGLGLVVAVSAAAAMLLVYRLCPGPALIKTGVILLASTVAAPVWSPRPQIFTLVLFAAVSLILHRYKRRQDERLWLLVPIFILWSNLHAGYTLGFILLVVVIVGELINSMTGNPGEDRMDRKRLAKLALWTAACALAVLVNPNGLATWTIPFRTVGVETLQQLIDEWASPDFHQLSQQPFLVMLSACLIAFGLARRRADGIDMVGLAGFGMLALAARRNFGPFALFAAPVLARSLWYAWSDLADRPVGWISWLQGKFEALKGQESNFNPRITRVINLGLAAFLAGAAFIKLAVVTHPVLVSAYEKQFYPTEAVEYLNRLPEKNRVFNSYGWGGYLIWRARHQRVFVDGRTDLFGDDILKDWVQVVEAQPGWEKVLDQWEVDYVLLEPTRPVVPRLAEQGWQLVFSDPVSVLYQHKK